MDCFALGTISLETGLVPFRLRLERCWRGLLLKYRSHTVVVYRSCRRVIASNRDAFWSMGFPFLTWHTIPLKNSAELIVLTLFRLKPFRLKYWKQIQASARKQINCRWRGVSLLHVAWSNETTGGTINTIKQVPIGSMFSSRYLSLYRTGKSVQLYVSDSPQETQILRTYLMSV